jgi:hypothetical protein
MQTTGWEIRTAGWIVIAIVAALLAYFIIQRLRNASAKTSN